MYNEIDKATFHELLRDFDVNCSDLGSGYLPMKEKINKELLTETRSYMMLSNNIATPQQCNNQIITLKFIL